MYNENDLFGPENNMVIGYVNGKAILKSENYPGRYFYVPIKAEYVTIGENIVDARMCPIEILSPEEQQMIYQALEGGERLVT